MQYHVLRLIKKEKVSMRNTLQSTASMSKNPQVRKQKQCRKVDEGSDTGRKKGTKVLVTHDDIDFPFPVILFFWLQHGIYSFPIIFCS